MDEPISLTKSSPVEDCVERFERKEVGDEVYRNKANGDDAGFEEYVEVEEVEEDA